MDRFEQITGQEVKNSVIFKESFCVNDFKKTITLIRGTLMA